MNNTPQDKERLLELESIKDRTPEQESEYVILTAGRNSQQDKHTTT